jgi:hypothetical protein
MKLHEAFSSDESKKIYDNFLAIVNDPKRRDRLVSKYGKNAENVAYGTAVNQVKKQAANNIEEPQPEETMENNRLREMVIDALTEKKKSFPDLTGDGKVTKADILKARGVKLEEDLDLGHEDNEPHMIKSELYRIGKYAMELYKMVDQFEGEQEVDFPHWWQAKIIEAKDMLVSAKHYLDFETKEPQLDAMVDVASEEGAIDEEMTPQQSQKKGMPFKNVAKEKAIDEMSKGQIKKRGEIYDTLKAKGIPDEKAGKIATSTAMKKKIKEAILAKLKNK